MAAGEVASGPGMHEVYGFLTLAVIAWIAYKARAGIASGIRGRSETVDQRLRATRVELEKVSEELAKVEADLKGLDKKKEQMIREAGVEAQRLADRVVEDARRVSQQMIEDAKLAAKNEATRAAKELRATMIDEAARQCLSLGLENRADAKALHEKLFSDLTKEAQ